MTLDATSPTEKLLAWLRDCLFALYLVENGEDRSVLTDTLRDVRREIGNDAAYGYIDTEVMQAVKPYLDAADNALWPTWTGEQDCSDPDFMPSPDYVCTCGRDRLHPTEHQEWCEVYAPF